MWQHVKKGVPLRLEIGPRDVAGDSVFVGRRDTSTKATDASRRIRRHDRRAIDRDSAESFRTCAGLPRAEHAHDRRPRGVHPVLYAPERRQAGDSRRLRAEPLRREPGSDGPIGEAEGNDPLPSPSRPTRQRRRPWPLHFHRPSEPAPGGICEGVLEAYKQLCPDGLSPGLVPQAANIDLDRSYFAN